MSPRKADPAVREALSEAAARLLAEEGPAALTTRRLGAEIGASTTAVYTHFGSKDEIVRSMVVEGFSRLARQLSRVKVTDDPVLDGCNLGWAYRRHALANPHLYAVMFGRTVAEFRPSPSDRAHGLPTLQVVVDATARAADAGRIRKGDPWLAAVELWTVAHGVVSLELDGFTGTSAPFHAVATLRQLMRDLMVGLGDDPALADASVARSRP
ncbi:MAG: TetR/AcrR family transcriptional regulator [Acidimicrobiales bacterium]